jgi:hypothetical protein
LNANVTRSKARSSGSVLSKKVNRKAGLIEARATGAANDHSALPLAVSIMRASEAMAVAL